LDDGEISRDGQFMQKSSSKKDDVPKSKGSQGVNVRASISKEVTTATQNPSVQPR
jgi:hypothetical protein